MGKHTDGPNCPNGSSTFQRSQLKRRQRNEDHGNELSSNLVSSHATTI